MEAFLQSESWTDELKFLGSNNILASSAADDADFCGSVEYTKFKWLEFGVKIVPSLIFFVTGTCRYLRIRDIGEGRVHYSKHFKTKFGISCAMCVAYLLYVAVVLVLPSTVVHSGWVNRCA